MTSQVYSRGLKEAALLGELGVEAVLAQDLTSEETLRYQVSECNIILYSKKPMLWLNPETGVCALHGTHTGVREQPSGVVSSLLLWTPRTKLRSSGLNYKCLCPLGHLASQHLTFSCGFYSSNPSPHTCTANITAGHPATSG